MKEEFKTLLQLNKELQDIVNSITDHPQTARDLKGRFLTFALGKGFKTYTAVVWLAKAGYGQDAAILIRSLFELMVITNYILVEDTDNRIERYNDYDWILRKEMFETHTQNEKVMAEINKKLKTASKGQDSLKEIAKRSKEAQRKHNYARYRWSDKSLRGMSEEVGRLDTYNSVYKLQSQLIHSEARSVNEYVSIEKGESVIMVGFSEKWVIESLVSAFDFLYHITKTYDEYFNSGLGSKLTDLCKKWGEEVGKLPTEGSDAKR